MFRLGKRGFLDVGAGQPIGRNVAAPMAGILDDIPGDVVELESNAQVAGTGQGIGVLRRDTHDPGHQAADRAGDMITIADEIFGGLRAPPRAVEVEAAQMVFDIADGQSGISVHLAQGREGEGNCRIGAQGAAGLFPQIC